ncbi:MAG: RNA polymerase factor sigma-54 [Bacteroidetes bacterium]|nr:RNA polymerase factor sigma-54 [Bacteroidota bacterium]
MLKQRLSQKLLQKLSPQQIQLMKLLQVPTASLDQRIKEELEANPALEEGAEDEELNEDGEVEESEETEENEIDDEIDISDYLNDGDDDIAAYRLKNGSSSEEEKQDIPIRVVTTFQEHLTGQLGLFKLDSIESDIAMHLIGSIDDDGYMRRDLISIKDDLAFSLNLEVTLEEIEEVLKKIQTFDPTGVCARDLQECLLLQLRDKEPDEDKYVLLAIRLLENYFDEFVKKHYEKLQRSLKIDNETLKMIIDEILKLNPKPGSAYSDAAEKSVQYVTPDFMMVNNDGELLLTLNSRNAPELRINESYKDMFKTYEAGDKKDKKQKEAVMFIKQKIDSAKWFIDAIKQRQATLLNTMQAIMEYQYEYFFSGDEIKLRPMILKDIAEITHLDISTVSRVASSKYVQTEFGTFQLKSFFSESLQTDSGEEVSTREVKKILNDMIDSEDKGKPLSDQKLMDMLRDKGYNIARRTVAKYREQLNIPVARLRKEL